MHVYNSKESKTTRSPKKEMRIDNNEQNLPSSTDLVKYKLWFKSLKN